MRGPIAGRALAHALNIAGREVDTIAVVPDRQYADRLYHRPLAVTSGIQS